MGTPSLKTFERCAKIICRYARLDGQVLYCRYFEDMYTFDFEKDTWCGGMYGENAGALSGLTSMLHHRYAGLFNCSFDLLSKTMKARFVENGYSVEKSVD